MRLNVWIYHNEDRKNERFHTFPYIAESILKAGEKKKYSCIEDVYKELLLLEQKTKENGGEVGKGLYNVLPFFVNDEKIIDINMFNTILKISYCKSSKTPPYNNINETPAKFVDDYLIVTSEINSILDNERKEKQQRANTNG